MDHGTAIIVAYLLTAVAFLGEVAMLVARRRRAWRALHADRRAGRPPKSPAVAGHPSGASAGPGATASGTPSP